MERFENSDSFEAWYEHWHRYHWIAPLLKNKTVGDLACGEGYGAALISQQAKKVFGVDIDGHTIEKAQKKYVTHPHLSFLQADLLNTSLEDDCLDAVVSFETLEHLSEQEAMLKEFKRVLKPGGLLVISTPDKNVYSDQSHHNHHHVKELTATEFKALIEQHFAHQVYFGQKLHLGSTIEIENNHDPGKRGQLYIEHGKEFNPTFQQANPMYMIAIASDSAANISEINASNSNLNDYNGALLKHYKQQMDRLQDADIRIPELERQLKQQLALVNHLKARLGL